ncbi:MAG: transposase, partial [Clostridiales bacterium]|nr:transposase [Clostridiales bacterium]
PRRVVVKAEKPTGQMLYMYTFIVTNMELNPESLIQFYCNRGRMENFIKESKNGFDFDSMSSHSKLVNANRLQISMLAYNLFNWFKRLVLPQKMRKLQVDTIRLKLIKIASRIVRSARYIIFKLCSSCPYKTEFFETLETSAG